MINRRLGLNFGLNEHLQQCKDARNSDCGSRHCSGTDGIAAIYIRVCALPGIFRDRSGLEQRYVLGAVKMAGGPYNPAHTADDYCWCSSPEPPCRTQKTFSPLLSSNLAII
jgi:hypothetical protein